MRLVSSVTWGVLAVVAFIATAALVAGAFTRFDGHEPPGRGDPSFAAYEDAQYDRARLSTALGLAAGFAFLGSVACAQQALRMRRVRLAEQG